jgi:hypothetical protein
MNKIQTKSTVLLKHHLKTLKMPTMHSECEKVSRRLHSRQKHLLMTSSPPTSAKYGRQRLRNRLRWTFITSGRHLGLAARH